MRITGGNLGGRTIEVPNTKIPGFRPTMDFLREVIFSSLTSYTELEEKKILDLYAGTGIFSFECLSRGAKHSYIVEKDPALCRKIEENALKLGINIQIKIEINDVVKSHYNSDQYNIVFADPPYQKVSFWDCYHLILKKNVLAEGAFFIYEDNSLEIKKLGLDSIEEKSGKSLRLLKSKTVGTSGAIICKYQGK